MLHTGRLRRNSDAEVSAGEFPCIVSIETASYTYLLENKIKLFSMSLCPGAPKYVYTLRTLSLKLILLFIVNYIESFSSFFYFSCTYILPA